MLTLVVAAIGCAGLSSLLMYAPQKTAADDIVSITQALAKDSLAMIKQINATGNNPAGLSVSTPHPPSHTSPYPTPSFHLF